MEGRASKHIPDGRDSRESQPEEDPRQFLAAFRTSSTYQSAFTSFFEGKKLADDVTEEEMRQAFENSRNMQCAVLYYAQEHGFSYNPQYYSKETQYTIRKYIDHIRAINQAIATGTTTDEIQQLDMQRAIKHLAVGQALVGENIAPNVRIGRIFGRLFLIEQRLDTFESAVEMK